MNKSDSTIKLFAALVAAQKEMTNPAFDSTNPFYGSEYVSLPAMIEHVKPVFGKHGLAVIQFPSGAAGVETILAHESGEWVSETAIFPVKDNTPQAAGASVSYLRRYGLQSVCFIAGEVDDDGNAASGKEGAQQATPANKWSPPAPSPASGAERASTVEKVDVSEGVSAKGPWKKWTVTFGDRTVAGTFDPGMGEYAQGYAKTKHLVNYKVEQSGKYLNLKSILGAESAKEAADDTSDLPF